LIESENNMIHGKLKKIDRRQESKIISQANKNFNIHLHLNRLRTEDKEYLNELNELINKKITYYTSPTLMS
jgi:hypothetical protein